MYVEKYIEEQLKDVEETHVFIIVRNGMVEKAVTNNARAIIHILDRDNERSEVIEWPETQV